MTTANKARQPRHMTCNIMSVHMSMHTVPLVVVANDHAISTACAMTLTVLVNGCESRCATNSTFMAAPSAKRKAKHSTKQTDAWDQRLEQQTTQYKARSLPHR